MSKTLAEEMTEFREACRDLGYLIVRHIGILWLVRRVGLQPKVWVREREIKDLHGGFKPKR